ncbi:MAG: LPXTG cell wall anchor domain-containing protein [Lachnospiraceae bacterium]|nr:LPXTG cell wall anchor domain-containing protein [Lachnospiraceae bacterium]
MKLMTKRLLAAAMVICLTLGMTVCAMANSTSVPDADLAAAGLDPDTAEELGRIDVPSNIVTNPSPQAGSGYSWDGKQLTVSFAGDFSDYTNLTIFHFKDGAVVEFKAGTSATFDSASPFVLVGEPKDASVADDDDDSSSSSKKSSSSSSGSSSSKKSSSSSSGSAKSPKTGMDDSWMLWLMAAGVFAGTSVVAYNRKKNF